MDDGKERDDNKLTLASQKPTVNSTVATNGAQCRDKNMEPRPVLNRKFLVKILKDFVPRFLRGFSRGLFVHAGLVAVEALLRSRSKNMSVLYIRKYIAVTIGKYIFSKNCLRTAMFCALYPSFYHFFTDMIPLVLKTKNAWCYSLVSGLAGLSAFVLDESRRQTLAIFTLTRALGTGLSLLVKRGLLPNVPLFEVGVFGACDSWLMYCASRHLPYLNQGYFRSTLKWSRDYSFDMFLLLFRNQGSQFLTCQEAGLHEGPCVQHQVIDFFRSLPDFAKMYLPIHLIPVLIFKRKGLKERPLNVLKLLIKNTIMSTLFLGSMMFLLKLSLCLLRNHAHQPPPVPAYVSIVSGAVAGFSLLFERYSRRKEMALFVLYQVLTGLYNIAKSYRHWLHLSSSSHELTIMFALSMMLIMYGYEREPTSLSRLVNSLIKFFVDGHDR